MLCYPYFTINGFPKLGKMFWFLVGHEGVFFIDICLNFFVQMKDKNGFTEDFPLSKVATNYMNGLFIVDLIVFIPFGALFTYINQAFKFVWIIKAYRIKHIQYYLSKRFFNILISSYINYRQGKSLEDEKLKNKVDEDLVYITQKIYISNTIKIARLVICIASIVYVVG